MERKIEAQIIFDELHSFLESIKDNYPPESEMGIGIKYFYTYWNSLFLYPECFESSPSNNAVLSIAFSYTQLLTETIFKAV